MPHTENLNLEKTFTSPEPSNTFGYGEIDLTDAMADAAQIQLRWEILTVTGPGAVPVELAQLPAAEREQIIVIDPIYYTLNPTASSLTVDYDALSDSVVTVYNNEGVATDYTRPPFSVISAVSPVKIRRSVDVTDAIVEFQSGSRLTSDQLNAAVAQVLFATQELSAFGSQGTLDSSVDLGNESINNLGDVSINIGNTGAILVVGQDGTITDSTTGGTNAVLSVNGDTGAVVLNYIDVGAAAAVHTHVMAQVTDLNISGVGGVDVTTTAPVAGDTLVFDGANWVPAQPVTVASGMGAPPSAWTNDPSRRPGDLYVRTG